MYTHKGKRIFFVTIREVKEDGTLGDSESFSVYESERNLSRKELVNYLEDKINETNKNTKN